MGLGHTLRAGIVQWSRRRRRMAWFVLGIAIAGVTAGWPLVALSQLAPDGGAAAIATGSADNAVDLVIGPTGSYELKSVDLATPVVKPVAPEGETLSPSLKQDKPQPLPVDPNGPPETPPEEPQLPPSALITDINDYWARDCIRTLADRRVVGTVTEGRFMPDERITWADYTGMLNYVFPTSGPTAWANPLERALKLPSSVNVANHYPSNYYQSDRNIIRADAFVALAAKLQASFVNRAHATVAANFSDAETIPDYAVEGVAAALSRRLVVSYPDPEKLEPLNLLTRGEAAALVCRAMPDPIIHQLIPDRYLPEFQSAPPTTAPGQEIRGVWLTNIDSEVLFSRENLEAAVNRLAELNFNTIYPAVWNWGYTLFPSATAARELGDAQHLYGENSTPQREAGQAERDMLAELVELAHARGMKVIPWFEFGFMTPENYVLHRNHPDWFTQKRVEPPEPDLELPDGPSPTDKNAPLPGVDLGPVLSPTPPPDPGIWLEGDVLPRRWLSPFHPQAQRFLLDIINDLMTNYEVDGLQVDDHLGLPVEFGYDPFTAQLYATQNGGADLPANPQDRDWMAWRANKISDFMGAISRVVQQRRPGAILSVSPNPYPFAYTNYLQDWPEWETRGYVDELVIQLYRDNQDSFIWEMNKSTATKSRDRLPTGIGILSGLRAKPVSIRQIQNQIDAARDRGYAGVSFFFYETLWTGPEPLETRLARLQEAFPSPASHPTSG